MHYTIVSQVNPHARLFFYDPRGSAGRPAAHRGGRGWRGGYMLAFLEYMLRLDLAKWLRVLRDLDLVPGWASRNGLINVWLQKFHGNVTILPKANWKHYVNLIRDPGVEGTREYMRAGRCSVWPRLAAIRQRMRIESAIESGRRLTRPSKIEIEKDPLLVKPVLDNESDIGGPAAPPIDVDPAMLTDSSISDTDISLSR